MPITVKSYLGRNWTFDTLEHAVLGINYAFPIHKLNRGFLNYRTTLLTGRQMSWGNGDDVIFFDEYGLLIPVWKVKETYANIPYKVRNPPYGGRWGWYKRHVKAEHYRRLPVPHVGKRYWRGDRHMRTLQEIRENDFLAYDEDAIEFGVKCRPNRNRGYLRTYWDDVQHSNYGMKSWKKHRANQWKA
jgi:hypothetical protein